jgi:hypothetical protein
MLDEMDDVVVREMNPTESEWPPKGAFYYITGEREYGRVPWGVQPNYGWGWTFSYTAFDASHRLVEASPLHWRAFMAEVDKLGGEKAKTLDGAALEAWAAAQPDLARHVLHQPMPGATFAGVRLVDRERKDNPVAWKRAAARDVAKAQDKAAIAKIETKLKELRADRRKSVEEVLGQCKAGRDEAVKRAKRLRKWANTTIVKAEAECKAERQEKGVQTAEEKRLLAALAAEKSHQAKIRREAAAQNRKKPSVAKAKPRNEKRTESDDEVEGNISADLLPLWRKVKKTIKATDKMSRTEAFLKYVEENPDDAVGAIEDDSEDELAKMIREYEQGAQKAYASNPVELGALPPAYEISIGQLRRWGAPKWIDYGSVVHDADNAMLIVQGFRVGTADGRPAVTQAFVQDQRTGKSRYVDITSLRPSRQLNPVERDDETPTDRELTALYSTMVQAGQDYRTMARYEGELTREQREEKHRALQKYNRLSAEYDTAKRRPPSRMQITDATEARVRYSRSQAGMSWYQIDLINSLTGKHAATIEVIDDHSGRWVIEERFAPVDSQGRELPPGRRVPAVVRDALLEALAASSRRQNPVRRRAAPRDDFDVSDLERGIRRRENPSPSTRSVVRNLMQRALAGATSETGGKLARQTRRIDHHVHEDSPYTITIQGRTNLTAPWIRLYSRELGRWSASIQRDSVVGLPGEKTGDLAQPNDEEAKHLEPDCGEVVCRRPNPTRSKKENPIIKGDEASFLRVREPGQEALTDDEREVKIDPHLQVVHDPDGRFFAVCDAMFLRRSRVSADEQSSDTQRHTEGPSKARRYYPSADLDENETLDRPSGPWHRVAQVDGIRYSRWFDEHGDGRYAQVPFQHPFSRPVVLEANGDESAYRLRLGSGCVWDERGLVVP